jgi:hypothetical protein
MENFLTTTTSVPLTPAANKFVGEAVDVILLL